MTIRTNPLNSAVRAHGPSRHAEVANLVHCGTLTSGSRPGSVVNPHQWMAGEAPKELIEGRDRRVVTAQRGLHARHAEQGQKVRRVEG